MGIQLNKILSVLSVLILISCKGNSQEKNQSQKSNNKEPFHEQIDFLDKKYFEKYELIIDESNISDHPFFSYLDCQKEGYFSVHFVPKDTNLRDFWKKDYYKDTDFNKYDFEKDGKRIEELINGKLMKYNIFSYTIKREFLNAKNGCNIESVFLKDNNIADIYLYNQLQKKWELMKSEKSIILPPYAYNEFFTSHFPELFIDIKKEKIPSNDNIAYSYDYDLNRDGINDKVVLYTNNKESGEFESKHFGLQMEIKKGLSNNSYQTWVKNDMIIPRNEFNCATEGFNNLVFKENYFTIENQLCSDYIEISSYITFKIVDQNIFLHKYGETYFDKENHNKKIPSKIWTIKDFGTKKFEDVTENYLFKLSQTKPKK